MTPRQRILSVYHGTPCYPPAVGIYSRYHRPGAAERRARERGLGLIAFHPVVSLLAPPWHVKPGYLSQVPGARFGIDYRWEGGSRIETRSFETPSGRVEQRLRQEPNYQSDWVEKHYLEEPGDYEVLADIVSRSVMTPQTEPIAQLQRDVGEDGVVLGRLDRSPFQKLLCELAEPQVLLMQLMTDPAPIDELVGALSARMDEQIDAAVTSAVDAVWQPDNVTSELTPPWVFERYLEPYYHRLGEKCRAAGKPLLIHLDGRLKPLAGLLARCPFDVVESFSLPEMGNDLTLQAAFDAMPNQTLCPNVPASLADAPRERVEAFVQSMTESFSGRPFMLQISEDVPLHRYQHLLDSLTLALETTP